MNNIVEFLKVYSFTDKIRLGEESDGGYVIGNILGNYDCYISAGVSNEESFSRDFIDKYNMNETNSYAFDGTIERYPYNYTNKITFIRRNIAAERNTNVANLSYFTEKFNHIFLKMDIEGGEYPWLLSLNEEKLNKFKQIVIEFHGINDNSWGTDFNSKLQCLKKLSDTHYLIHIHGNNYASVSENGIPDVVELTYIRKDYFSEQPELNKSPLPILGVDFPNIINSKDYDLNFPPFVN
jgi:FkbM family methyltransferase